MALSCYRDETDIAEIQITLQSPEPSVVVRNSCEIFKYNISSDPRPTLFLDDIRSETTFEFSHRIGVSAAVSDLVRSVAFAKVSPWHRILLEVTPSCCAEHLLISAGRDWICHHMEVSFRGFEGWQHSRGILFCSSHQSLSTSRYRHKDDPHWEEQQIKNHIQGYLSREVQECV